MDHSRPHHRCCTCGLSRRGFLSGMAMMAGAGALAARARATVPGDLGDDIDVDALRPSAPTKVMMGVLRYPPPYWLGWPGTSYDVEGHRTRFTSEIRRTAAGLGIRLKPEEAAIEDDAAVAAFLARAEDERPDAILVMLQHLGVWHWAQRIADAGWPTIVFSPIGTSFTGHVLEISRQPGVHVISSLEIEAVEQALRMVKAKRMMEDTRLLVIAGSQRYESALPALGTKVRHIPRRTFRDTFEQMPETAESRAVADAIADEAKDIVEPTREDLLNMARTYTTAKRVLAEEGAHGLSMDCLGMVGARVVPTPPCGAWTLLQDQGITAGCEADLFGATSLLFVSHVLGRPGFMNDPVAETFKNRLIVAHCTSGTRLGGFGGPKTPYILRSHSESDLGVSTQVLWPEGEKCTLVRFTEPGTIIVDTGTIEENVQTPPAGGCRTSFEVTMDRVEDARDVLGFHQVVTLGDHRRTVQAYAQLFGLEVTHSPERAPENRGDDHR
ncbi:MAG: hypothetical protein KBA64_08160 [Armatimonadetes bacterium]|jgi:hypothetical protein|nr:hypothetical protein [Armatimonadota bacterium]MDI9601509.1 hypothetical protein [Acidobacteriota bacterium]NLN89764.1 hypothetical protein [candidate division WS1 bacterium]